MKNLFAKLILAVTAMFGIAPMASAISFTAFSYSGPGVMIPTPVGFTGYAFIIQAVENTGTGLTTATINYTVTADAGQYLSAVDLLPNGTLENGASVNITATHPSSATASLSQTNNAVAPVAIGNNTTALPGFNTSYNVSLTINLSGSNANSFGKVSVMQVNYAQQAVPEPASMLALSAGVLAMIRKRKGAK